MYLCSKHLLHSLCIFKLFASSYHLGFARPAEEYDLVIKLLFIKVFEEQPLSLPGTA